ncbi:MAG: AsmA2 domain-containing protein YhdP [Enterobacteriaceae bacterium]
MKRLSRVFFLSGTLLLVIIALLITGFRLALPQIEHYKPQIEQSVARLTGVPLNITSIDAQWRNFGPSLQLQGVSARWPQGEWQTQKITMALDVWQSLLQWRWQFRNLTFHQLQLRLTKAPFDQEGESDWLSSSVLSDVVLHQLDHFTLRDSHILFPGPAGEEVALDIDELTWLNSDKRHRAEGMLSVYSNGQQRGQFQVRMDMRDRGGALDKGTLYLQADDIDIKPWLSRWLRTNTGLTGGRFSLATWVGVEKGQIRRIDTQLKQGSVGWNNSGAGSQGEAHHQLAVDNLLLKAQRIGDNWRVDLPQLNLATDGQTWPKGQLSAWWVPQQQELRLRAASLAVERIMPLLPPLALLTPQWLDDINQWQIQGNIERLALDLSLQAPEQSRFTLTWNNLGWQADKEIPLMEHFSGEMSGSLAEGRARLRVGKGESRYHGMFRAPLEIDGAQADLGWNYKKQGAFRLWGDNIDIKARSLWFRGQFNFDQPQGGKPWLGILGGIRLYDAKQAWRYYPEPLMGTSLTNYLTAALQGGNVDDATLIYAGNPQDFPFNKRNGLFQVVVPLENSTFQFDPEWPALENLKITLNFLNDGLWMWAPAVRLGEVEGRNVQAVIPRYSAEKLLVNAEVAGDAAEVQNYFRKTPLEKSIAQTLDEVVIKGNIAGRLHLAIPFTEGSQVLARGSVMMPGNDLTIKTLGLTFDQVKGQFRFNNGDLRSDTLSAHWSHLPLTLRFDTEARDKEYLINSELQGNWSARQLPGVPHKVAARIEGKGQWHSKIEVKLPEAGKLHYQGQVDVDLREVSSRLPAPLDKPQGAAAQWNIAVKGDDKEFTLSGAVNNKQHFNSQWSLQGETLARLLRGVWSSDARVSAQLPKASLLRLNLPALDGMGLADLLVGGEHGQNMKGFAWPERIEITTPSLLFARQQWQQLAVTVQNKQAGEQLIELKGREINGQVEMTADNLWRLNFAYLYYNPHQQSAADQQSDDTKGMPESTNRAQPEQQWPSIQFQCQDCWLFGQRLRHIEAQVETKGNNLKLQNALVDTGNTRLQLSGNWLQQGGDNQTKLSGTLSGDNIGTSLNYFGLDGSVKKSPFKVKFDLDWHDVPWQPQFPTLSGTLDVSMGRGEISDMGGGRAGQLLRLLSFDALLRKLRLDFSDTFGQAFYFDSIRSHGTIKQGVIYTDDLLVDGLAADIAMRGSVDLVQKRIEMQATVAPELSATVGVATAFAVNPLAGAALFAATRVLGPIWNKISLIRYQISGSLEHPAVEEIQRESREKKSS